MDDHVRDQASNNKARPSGGAPTARLQTAEAALRQADRRVLRRATALYLNGTRLDRGVLRLTSHSLRFDGWQGSVVIPLRAVSDVRLGTSVLPRHAGIPVLARLWPGSPHYAESLLISVTLDASGELRVATVAGLRDGGAWRDEILRCREAYGDWARERADRVAEIRAAERKVAGHAPTPDESAGRDG